MKKSTSSKSVVFTSLDEWKKVYMPEAVKRDGQQISRPADWADHAFEKGLKSLDRPRP